MYAAEAAPLPRAPSAGTRQVTRIRADTLDADTGPRGFTPADE
jgi:hypothetical protein